MLAFHWLNYFIVLWHYLLYLAATAIQVFQYLWEHKRPAAKRNKVIAHTQHDGGREAGC